MQPSSASTATSTALTALAERAAGQGCQIIAFPEDTLGTLEWEAGHWDEAKRPPPLSGEGNAGALRRGSGQARRLHHMPVMIASSRKRSDNTAILLGPDGREIGRYRKVQPTLAEQSRSRGSAFPVFEVPGVGTVGLCICYDMVFPETTRALALAGADIVFHVTMGGASMAGQDASLAAFRTRAADNFLYIVVAFRGGGSLIIGPRGEISWRGRLDARRHRNRRYRPHGRTRSGRRTGRPHVRFPRPPLSRTQSRRL